MTQLHCLSFHLNKLYFFISRNRRISPGSVCPMTTDALCKKSINCGVNWWTLLWYTPALVDRDTCLLVLCGRSCELPSRIVPTVYSLVFNGCQVAITCVVLQPESQWLRFCSMQRTMPFYWIPDIRYVQYIKPNCDIGSMSHCILYTGLVHGVCPKSRMSTKVTIINISNNKSHTISTH